MKFIFIAALLLVVFVLFRRLGREQSVGTNPMRAWEQRPPLPFDDFYAQYYSTSGMDKGIVRSALQQVAQLIGAPSEGLRPEDRLDELKPGALDRTLGMMRRLSQSPLVPESVREKLNEVDWNIVTVDDYIRKLGHLGEHLHAGGN